MLTIPMAELVDVYDPDDLSTPYVFKRRQMPLTSSRDKCDKLWNGFNSTMVMQLPLEFIQCHPNKEWNRLGDIGIDKFTRIYNTFTRKELSEALTIPSRELFNQSMHELISCVGCRRSIEQLFNRLNDKRLTKCLSPLLITADSELTFDGATLSDPRKIYNLFNPNEGSVNVALVKCIEAKKNRRCPLHSLDNPKTRQISKWIDAWYIMDTVCQEEVTLILTSSLHSVTTAYLKKHRFCAECKSKVMRAYQILVGEAQPCDEKGYCSILYEGLRCCPQDKHIHLLCDTDFIGQLIARAEPELSGIRIERHAKTIDIAQEEILTCLGIEMHTRLSRIHKTMKSEEQTWLLLFLVGVLKLEMAFAQLMEAKDGKSKLEKVCEEYIEADRIKSQKQALKKQRRKARKRNKNSTDGCGESEGGCDRLMDGGKVEHMCQVEASGEGVCACEHDLNDNTDILCKVCVTDVGSKPAGDKLNRNEGDYSSGIDCGDDCGQSSRDGSVGAGSESSGNHDVGSLQDKCIHSCSMAKDHDNLCGDNSTACQCRPPTAETAKCNGGKTLDCTHCKQQALGDTGQILKICDCSTEAQLRHALGWTSTLKDMLENSLSSDDESFIPAEDIERFLNDHKYIDRQRKKLRAKIRNCYNKKFSVMNIDDTPDGRTPKKDI